MVNGLQLPVIRGHSGRQPEARREVVKHLQILFRCRIAVVFLNQFLADADDGRIDLFIALLGDVKLRDPVHRGLA